MSTIPQAPAPVRVTAWGELRAERNIPGALRVMVDGQAAGGAERIADGTWRATWYTAAYRDRLTLHANAQDAVRTVIRSGWARKLGARKASAVTWSDKAARRGHPAGGDQ